VPIGPDDILPEARNAPIPRTTRVSSHGAIRVNRLEPDFALGSISGRCPNSTHGTQFLLAWRSKNPRCAIPFLTDDRNQPESHFSSQRNGSLLAASLWMVARETKTALPSEWWKSGFSGLNTGRPDCLVRDADFRPGYTLELGARETVRLLGEGGPVAAAGEVSGSCLAVETETIIAAVRFFTAGGPVAMRLEEKDGELTLSVAGSREGIPVSRIETAAFCGFLLHVRPKKEITAEAALKAISAAVVTVTARADGWTLSGPAADGAPLAADVPAVPSVLYSVEGGERVTANLWAESFR